MDDITATDAVFGIGGAGLVDGRNERMELVNEQGVAVSCGGLLDSGGEFFEVLDEWQDRRALIHHFGGGRGAPGDSDVSNFRLVGDFLHGGGEVLVLALIESASGPAAIVHSEVHSHGGGSEGQHIALEAFAAAASAIAADTYVEETYIFSWETGERPGFHITAIQMLFGDAVAHHDDLVTVFQKEVVGGTRDGGQEHASEGGQEHASEGGGGLQGVFHGWIVSW